jgi:peptide/nickel transport system substrate-binding protein
MKVKVLVAALTLAGISLVACSGGGGSTNSKRVFTLAYSRDWAKLDPAIAFAAETDILSQVYESLTIYNPKTQKVEPMLATSWTHNADATQWTFHIRSGVKFQDGSTFDCSAVNFTIERELKINQGPAYIWSAVKSIDCPDPLTAVLNLSQAQPMDLLSASGWGAFMMSPKSDDQPSDWFNAGRGIGTGAYMYVSYQPGQTMVLTQFKNYWGGWKSDQFTDVVVRFVPDATTREQLIRSGQATAAVDVSRPDLPSLAQSYRVTSVDRISMVTLILNVKKSPTNNLLVRKALLYAVPGDIVKSVFSGYANPVISFGPENLWGTNLPLQGYSLDLTKARQLLTQAGYGNGGLTLEYTSNTDAYPEEERFGELWKANLAQIGVTLNIKNITFAQKTALFTQPNPALAPQASIFEWTPTYASLQDYLLNSFGSSAYFHLAFYTDTGFDTLVNDGLILSATDQNAAAVKFQMASQQILDQAVGIPIADFPEVWVSGKNLAGFKSTPFAVLYYSFHVT